MTGRKPHRRGSYETQAKLVTQAAAADPMTKCWRCNKLLHEHPLHKTGRRPFWTAGHVYDGVPESPLLPEVSTCNFTAKSGAAKPLRSTRRW